MNFSHDLLVYLTLCVLEEGPVYTSLVERSDGDVETLVWALTAPHHPRMPVEAAVGRALTEGLRACEARRLVVPQTQAHEHSGGEYLVIWWSAKTNLKRGSV